MQTLEDDLVALTKAIVRTLPPALDGDSVGLYDGVLFENGTFMMHPYCWCDRPDCLWCTVWLGEEHDASDEESLAHRKAQTSAIAATFGANSYNSLNRAPNFWHKRTGLKVNWYKRIGDSMEVFNPQNADIAGVMRECIASIAYSHADEVERLRRVLHDIAEEWAGAECGEPVYAQEAYAIALAKRMYTLAVEGLRRT